MGIEHEGKGKKRERLSERRCQDMHHHEEKGERPTEMAEDKSDQGLVEKKGEMKYRWLLSV